MSTIRSSTLTGFRGLDERLIYGSDPTKTTSLDNVIVRNGVVSGRKGIALWDGISSAATNIITGLAEFYAPATATSTLLRIHRTKLEKWTDSTNSWDDITGTALTGADTDRPCFATMSDEGFVVFTNEGHDRPRKYTGTGNSAVLGGTPPFAKWLWPYVGFLFLFNTSTDGTFGAIADSITCYFSDIPDGDWALCEGNTIIFDESPGELRAAMTFGDGLVVFKSDCLVLLRFVGGITRFNRRKLAFSHGILAPLSLQQIGDQGLIFLATDRNLYRTDGNQVVALPPAVQKSLQETMTPAVAANCRGYVDISHETYHLLYQRNSTTYFDGRLSVNYRTGEFYRAAYTGYEFTAALGYRTTNNVNAQLVVAANDKKVYEQETGTDDAATTVSRIYDVDWTQFGVDGEKWLTGTEMTFIRNRDLRVRVSVAVDKSSKFIHRKVYSLRGTDPDETEVRIDYKPPHPVFGTWFKIRIEMFHDAATNVCELKSIGPEIIPIHAATETSKRREAPLSA